jgi:hypothetical protein
MKRLVALSLLLFVITLTAPARAQPDRTEALAKAKTKFEQDVSKAEDALIASIDKGLKSAANNKQLSEKLAYERELFVNHRIIPTVVANGTYIKQRTQAITALEMVYRPAIKELNKAKKEGEAEALEAALSDLVKTARGYGLAIPDLGLRPPLLIENKATGQVIEPSGKEGTGHLVLGTKIGKRKPTQCWYLDRDEKGFTLTNAQTGKALHVFNQFSGDPPVQLLSTIKIDPLKEVPDRSLFKLTETRREVVLSTLLKGTMNGYVFSTAEKKQKGITVYDLTIEKKETSPTPNQLWIITEAK